MAEHKLSKHPRVEARYRMIEAILAEEWPQSVRQIFYRCTSADQPWPMGKKHSEYTKVDRYCLQLRHGGRVPWDRIDDFTRHASRTPTWSTAESFVAANQHLYRASPWGRSPVRVQVWCESEGIGATLAKVARAKCVDLFPTRGQSSDAFLWKAARDIVGAADRRPVEVLYVGDHDQAGLDCEKSIREKYPMFCADWHGVEIDIRTTRLAVTPEQAELLPATVKRNPSTSTRWAGGPEVQAQSIPATELRRIVADAIDALLPNGALDDARIAETRERAKLQAFGRSDA